MLLLAYIRAGKETSGGSNHTCSKAGLAKACYHKLVHKFCYAGGNEFIHTSKGFWSFALWP